MMALGAPLPISLSGDHCLLDLVVIGLYQMQSLGG